MTEEVKTLGDLRGLSLSIQKNAKGEPFAALVLHDYQMVNVSSDATEPDPRPGVALDLDELLDFCVNAMGLIAISQWRELGENDAEPVVEAATCDREQSAIDEDDDEVTA